ncbi:MAG TPA: DUF547 domain-containing protein [Hyphomonadaceae bacterium]|nr:DUF547 domain-containing protein [Hyphomonadaceae bacterium]
MRSLAFGAAAAIVFVMPAFANVHQSWTEILSTYVKTDSTGLNRFDYAKLKASAADSAKLDKYIVDLQKLTPSKMTDKEAFAYWANLYNAATVQVIIQNYPVKSIRDINKNIGNVFGGPWKLNILNVEGNALSLDHIEHGILRGEREAPNKAAFRVKDWKDPRVHYAVNCASIGCPNLPTKAFTAETLDADLDAGARAYVNHPRAVTVRADGRLTVSSIYKWFKVDFGNTDAGVIAHLTKYAKPELAAKLKASKGVAGDAYDWSINSPAVGRS